MNNTSGTFNNILDNFKSILTNPDNFDLWEKAEQIKGMLTTLTNLENQALISQNIEDSFSAQELIEIITREIEQLTKDLELAKKLKWTQFYRKIFAQYTEVEIAEIQKLMTLWNMGTYSSIAESIIDHAYRKDYEDNFLEYLRDASNFDKTKARRIPSLGLRDDDTVRWENYQTGEYLIEDNLGKIRTYGTN